MSTINFIAATQPSIPATTGKSTASQTVATAQPEPAANASSATISQAARDALAAALANASQQSSSATSGQSTAPQTAAQSRSAADTSGSAIPANSEPFFKQAMADKFAGGNAIRAMIQNDPSDTQWAKHVDIYAEHDFTAGLDIGYDISHTTPGASGNPTIDGILRYSSGEIVTAESRAYVTQQMVSYQNQLRDMISSEKAKGTAPSDILLKIFDQQGEQPSRFRSYTMWPIASDFASNQPSAASGEVKT